MLYPMSELESTVETLSLTILLNQLIRAQLWSRQCVCCLLPLLVRCEEVQSVYGGNNVLVFSFGF